MWLLWSIWRTVSVYAYAGTVVTILWQDSWSPGPFTFTVEESAPPTAPQNLMAMGGVEAAYLEWDAMIDPFADGAMNNSTPRIDIDYAMLKLLNVRIMLLRKKLNWLLNRSKSLPNMGKSIVYRYI